MVYQWKTGTHYSKKQFPAQAIGEHLERLREESGGLTPEIIVDDARERTAPTHGLFEWNNERAASGYRLIQARHLVRSIAVVVSIEKDGEQKEVVTRAFVSTGAQEERGYKPVTVALRNDDDRTHLLMQAARDLAAFKKKYEVLTELSGLFDVIEETLSTLGDGTNAGIIEAHP
jgi:hypothetical protein